MKLTNKTLSDIKAIAKIASHTAFGETSSTNGPEKQQLEGLLQTLISRVVTRAINEFEKTTENPMYEDYSRAVLELSKRIGGRWIKTAEN